MICFLLKRGVALASRLVAASVVVFLIMQALPGAPRSGLPTSDLVRSAADQLRAQAGIELPLVVEYLNWLAAALHGDLGRSATASTAVSDVLLLRLPVTVHLVAASLGLALALAAPLGVIAAMRRGGIVDRLCRCMAFLAAAMPVFWQAMVMILVFAVILRWLPAGGYVPPARDLMLSTQHMLLPAIALATGFGATILRTMRAATIEALASDHPMTARAFGLSDRRVFWGHAMRLALVPTLGTVSAALGQLLAGAVLIETIFDLPGLGRLVVESIRARDYAPLPGVLLASVTFMVLVTLASDVLRGLLDRRVRTRVGI